MGNVEDDEEDDRRRLEHHHVCSLAQPDDFPLVASHNMIASYMGYATTWLQSKPSIQEEAVKKSHLQDRLVAAPPLTAQFIAEGCFQQLVRRTTLH